MVILAEEVACLGRSAVQVETLHVEMDICCLGDLLLLLCSHAYPLSLLYHLYAHVSSVDPRGRNVSRRYLHSHVYHDRHVFSGSQDLLVRLGWELDHRRRRLLKLLPGEGY